MADNCVHEWFGAESRATEVGVSAVLLDILDPDQRRFSVARVLHELFQSLLRNLPASWSGHEDFPSVKFPVGQDDGAAAVGAHGVGHLGSVAA